MFSYQHRYHAGNFADVHKHIILVALINCLKKKDTAFAVMDAHAGEGIYDLQDKEAQKNKEHHFGVFRLTNTTGDPLADDYLRLIQSYNEGALRYYPGSSGLIAALLRPQDRGILVEGHPQAAKALRTNLAKNKQLHIHERDSGEALLALLPFKEKRGLIFLDPSYEVKSEYTEIVDTLAKAYAKFQHGVYALWYPILPEKRHLFLHERLKSCVFKDWICHEWLPYGKPPVGQLEGSGMIIINPPYQLKEQIEKTFKTATASFHPQ